MNLNLWNQSSTITLQSTLRKKKEKEFHIIRYLTAVFDTQTTRNTTKTFCTLRPCSVSSLPLVAMMRQRLSRIKLPSFCFHSLPLCDFKPATLYLKKNQPVSESFSATPAQVKKLTQGGGATLWSTNLWLATVHTRGLSRVTSNSRFLTGSLSYISAWIRG